MADPVQTTDTTIQKPAVQIRPSAQTARAQKAAENAEILAKLKQHQATVSSEKPVEPEVKDEPAEETETDEPIEAKTEIEADDEPEPKVKDKVKAWEKRVRSEVAREREEMKVQLERRERELAPQLEKGQKFDTLAERAKYDAARVLRELGLSDDDLTDAAKQVYAHSTEGAKDPKNKDAAARMSRDREERDRVAKLEKKLADMENEAKTSKQKAEQEAAMNGHLDEVVKDVTDDSPIVKKWLEKSPRKAREALATVVQHLYGQLDEVPDNEDVIATLEKWRRSELEEMGVDVSAYTKSKTKPAEKPKALVAPNNGKATGRSALDRRKAENEQTLAALHANRAARP